MPPDVDAQIRNVLSGRSAYGGQGFKRMSFPRDTAAFVVVRHYLMRFSAECSARDDRTRTAFIRKLAHYLIRLPEPICTVDVHDGMTWFLNHPEEVCSPLSFAGAVRRARECLARESNAAEKERREATRRAMDAPMPPPPVLYRDGGHALREVVHPKQLMIVGLAAGNCLARRNGGRHSFSPRFWSLISRKLLRLFTLWEGTRLLCVFSVTDGFIREWQYVAPAAAIKTILPACLSALMRETGPLDATHALVFGETFLDFRNDGSIAIRQALEAPRDRI